MERINMKHMIADDQEGNSEGSEKGDLEGNSPMKEEVESSDEDREQESLINWKLDDKHEKGGPARPKPERDVKGQHLLETLSPEITFKNPERIMGHTDLDTREGQGGQDIVAIIRSLMREESERISREIKGWRDELIERTSQTERETQAVKQEIMRVNDQVKCLNSWREEVQYNTTTTDKQWRDVKESHLEIRDQIFQLKEDLKHERERSQKELQEAKDMFQEGQNKVGQDLKGAMESLQRGVKQFKLTPGPVSGEFDKHEQKTSFRNEEKPTTQIKASSDEPRTHREGNPHMARCVQIQIFRGEPGDCPQEHLGSLRELFFFSPASPEEQVAMANHYLRGTAKDWWKSLQEKPKTFEEYEAALLRSYWNEERQDGILHTLSNEKYRPNHKETHTQFFLRQVARLRSLTAFNYSDPRIIRIIRPNMPPWVQKLMFSTQIDSVDEMARFLNSMDYGNLTPEPSDRIRRIDEPRIQMIRVGTQLKGRKWKSGHLGPLEKGHPEKHQGIRTNKACLKHQKCYQEELVAGKGPSMTIVQEAEAMGRRAQKIYPIIDITIGTCQAVALLDSGCEVSLVSRKWLIDYQYQAQNIMKLPTRPIHLTMANGKKAISENYQVWLEVTMGKETFGHPFLVMAGLIHEVVLGSDFMAQQCCTLNYERMVCLVREQTIAFSITGKSDTVNVGCLAQPVDVACIAEKVKESAVMDTKKRNELQQTLEENQGVFSNTPGEIKGYVHRIRMREQTYIQSRTYPIPFQYRDEVGRQIQHMMDWGIIERSPSPHNNPLVVVKKKNGDLRLCLDARKLNSLTIPERDSPPSIQELFVKFAGCRWFSTIDLTSSYWQMVLDPRDRKYTAFRYNGQTHVFKRVPFGLINSGAGLIRCLSQVLSEELQKHIICYVDDIVIASEGLNEHLDRLKKFFQECTKGNITINFEKSSFCLQEVTFLGHIINGQGIKPHPEKIEAIQRFPKPTIRRHVRAFLGLCNFYHKFYPDFAQETSSLVDLLRKGQRWTWTVNHDQAFEHIKANFLKAVILHHPDLTRPFYVQTDSSKKGLGAVLFQVDEDGKHRVLYFSSRTLKGAEHNYTTTEQETLAIVWACQKFRQFLLGSEVIILSDHKCLEFLNKGFLTNDRLIRWSLALQRYSYKVIYCPGSQNIVADTLSRHPIVTMPQNPELPNQTAQVMAMTRELPRMLEMKNLRYWQDEDREYGSIIRDISDMGGRTPQGNLVKRGKYQIRDGLLQIRTRDCANPWRIVVPAQMRDKIIEYVHQDIGHYGPRKTEEAIRRRFYWPGIYAHILAVLRRCNSCARTKHPNRSYAGPSVPVMANEPNELLAIDHYGPLPKFRRMQYLLVTYDVFSKYVQIYPVQRTDSKSVIRVLQNQQFMKVGKPKIVLSDHGSAFTSREWKMWITKQKVAHRLTSIRNPQSNPCERVMRELSRLFRTYTSQDHRRWVDHAGRVADYINNTMNESTGFTPRRLHFGIRGPDLFPSLPPENIPMSTKTDQEQARLRMARMAKARVRGERNHHHVFQEGDQVWLRNPKQSNVMRKEFHKFFPVFTGPYVIHKKYGKNAFLLKDRDSLRGTYNARQLKPYLSLDPGMGE